MANSNLQLLQASVDPEEESEFRMLVDRKAIKYLTIDHGVYDVDTMCFGPELVASLPQFPPGEWNTGYVRLDESTNRPQLTTSKVQYPQITNSWHPMSVDHLDFSMGKKLRTNVYQATSAHFKSEVIMKFATFAWEIPQLNAETLAYSWIQGHGIGPEFLGHVTEEGRTIGFAMTQISNARHPTPDDLAMCQQVLSRLHRMGIKHGDINKHNFMIQGDRAFLIDFDIASRCNDDEILNEEFEKLEAELRDTSGRGGVIVMSSVE